MSLNCLSCQMLQRSDSERECRKERLFGELREIPATERGWSEDLSLRAYDRDQERSGSGFRMMAEKKAAVNGHRRVHSTGGVCFGGGRKEPKLVRSSGMRRDWSFEDLRNSRADNKPRNL